MTNGAWPAGQVARRRPLLAFWRTHAYRPGYLELRLDAPGRPHRRRRVPVRRNLYSAQSRSPSEHRSRGRDARTASSSSARLLLARRDPLWARQAPRHLPKLDADLGSDVRGERLRRGCRCRSAPASGGPDRRAVPASAMVTGGTLLRVARRPGRDHLSIPGEKATDSVDSDKRTIRSWALLEDIVPIGVPSGLTKALPTGSRRAVCEAVSALPAVALVAAGESVVVATAIALEVSAGPCASSGADPFADVCLALISAPKLPTCK